MRFTKKTMKDDGNELVMTIETDDAGEANTLRATGWEQIDDGDKGAASGPGAGSPTTPDQAKPGVKESRTEPDRVGFDAPKVTRTGKTD